MRAQVATEYTLLTAVSIALFAVVAVLVYSQMGDIGKVQALDKTRGAMQDITNAANEVYLQGSGARKTILVSLPAEIDPATLAVLNNSVTVKFRDSDISVKSEVPIYGTFQNETTFYLDVVSEGMIVRIGVPQFVTSPTSLFYSMCANITASQNKILTVTNNQNSSTEVNITLSWGYAGVNVTVSDSSVNLSQGESKNITVTAAATATNVNVYTGSLTLYSSSYSLTVPITISTDACGGANATNVSQVRIHLYKNSSYATEKVAFDLPQNATITTGNWSANSTVTLDIRDPSNMSVSGYPKNVLMNSSGGYSESVTLGWSTLGIYTVVVNDSTITTNSTFNWLGCT